MLTITGPAGQTRPTDLALSPAPSAAVAHQLMRRRAIRVAAGDSWQLKFDGPDSASAVCRIVDCSMTGMAVRGYLDTLAQIEIDALGQATLEIAHRPICAVLLTVRHTRPEFGDAARVVGLKVDFATAQDKRAYQSAVRGVLFAHVRAGARFSDAAWRMLCEAQRSAADGQTLLPAAYHRDAFFAFNHRLECARSLGQQLVWQDAEGIDASVAWVKPFALTQVLHHLGCAHNDAASRRSVHELLLCCLEMALADKQTRHLAAFVEQGVGLDRFEMLPFAQLRQDSGHAQALPARYFDVDTLCDAKVSFDARLAVRPATDHDAGAIADAVVAHRGGLYAHAFDMTAQTLFAKQACEAWAQAELMRERHVMLVCGPKHKPLVAAILDRVAPGADVFGALDTMVLVPLHTQGLGSDEQAILSLALAYAKNWFLLRGAGQFRFVDLDDALDKDQTPGAVLRSTGAVWLVNRPVFGALQTFWQVHYSARGIQSPLQ